MEGYLTVSALTKYIKYKFDCDYHLEQVLLEGEISNFKKHSRGHFYFTLKDNASQISAMMFADKASKVLYPPKDGDHVYIKGRVSVYEASGTYQIIVSQMELDGVGNLYLQFEKLKKELNDAGYFNPLHKKPIPKYPKKIGVVTSPTGAAIHDIINTVRRRYPLTEIILYPALVQGKESHQSIVSEIEKANADALVDVLIVGRGGGSIEDLWAFNMKEVALAIYNSRIPIISAVGHEVDVTIADYVADKRAATPTAAAEIATPSSLDLIAMIKDLNLNLNKMILRKLDDFKMKLAALDDTLARVSPKELLVGKRKEINQLNELLNIHIKAILDRKEKELSNLPNLNNNILHILNLKKEAFNSLKVHLEALSPLKIMDRGYSILKKEDKVINSVSLIKKEDLIDVSLKDGSIKALVMEVKNGK